MSKAPSPDSGFRDAAAAALADVDALGVTGVDRTTILEALLRARLRGSSAAGAAPSAPQASAFTSSSEDQQLAVDDRDPIGKIAARLGIERDRIDLVYALQNGEPDVVVSTKRIAINKSLGTRQLAQLVATARQVSGIEEWTGASAIRRVVTTYGRLDGSNYAATLQQMDTVALVRGKGQQREIKMTKPGLELTADLIRSLTEQ